MKFPLPSPQRRGGFSLAESIISVGIASSALLAVIGLLAGTLGGARETRVETVAGMVARQMLAEAREDMQGTSAPVLPRVSFLMLDSAMQTMASSRTDSGLAGVFQGGSADPQAAYFARSEVVISQAHPGMFEAHVTVEAPAAAPAGKRKVHRYVSLIAPP